MPDTKRGREEQARHEVKRQRRRALDEERERGDEAEPPDDRPVTCHRRGCNDPAAFVVTERYQEETGHGAVTAEAFLCLAHTDEESPANLDGAYDDYVFRVDPIPAAED
ncbi:hypothetical protein [Haloplanus halophilus]|uniref:hypothetical protein n=1 Tax=Haloplanus halophilus TaxID=2949993 RepID=UPI0020411CF4|nr:hypothetical protein [Haloplanus sp. GDY1]